MLGVAKYFGFCTKGLAPLDVQHHHVVMDFFALFMPPLASAVWQHIV
jgi:hypothetical protein